MVRILPLLVAMLVVPRSIGAQSDDETIRMLVWNIQRAAAAFENGPEKALAILRETNPDVCLLQESYDIEGDRPTLGRWLASQLGWNVHQGESPHLCVLTRLEIVETEFHHAWHGVGARLRDEDGRELIAYSTWIDYRAYLPHHLRDHPECDDEALLACEHDDSRRVAQTRALVAHLQQRGHLDDSGTPLLVGGDWNCPSHLDWTDETARTFRFRRPIALPVSMAMHEQGFSDAFRMVHPNAVQHPGITWSPLDRGSIELPETSDRIDRLYVKSPHLHPVAASVLPTVFESGVAEAQRAFPSDHGAVIIDIRWAATTESADEAGASRAAKRKTPERLPAPAWSFASC